VITVVVVVVGVDVHDGVVTTGVNGVVVVHVTKDFVTST
jgi:hypothetical protein